MVQTNSRPHPATQARPPKRMHILLFVLLLMPAAGLLAACGDAGSDVGQVAAGVPDKVQDYVSRYEAQFDLEPRRSGEPIEIAEAYLQQYQPGPVPRVFQHTIITDRHGTLLAELMSEGRRTWIPLEQVSPHLINAIVATEDATFYSNQGVDSRRVIGALLQNVETGGVVSGASTITMQLARNLFLPPSERYDQSVERKIFEVLLAQDLTRLYTKDEILEMYLNLIYFGHRAYGVEAAAQAYFCKGAADLTLAEASLLAGIPQEPASLDPLVDFGRTKARQRTVLDLLANRSYIPQEMADAVFDEAIALAPEKPLTALKAPHFVQFVQEAAKRELGIDNAARAGLRIKSTLDLPMQELAERIVREQVSALRGRYNLSSAALVALKPGTAEVLTMVGSADYYDDAISGKVNVAVSLRQPGSSIKPVLYAAAFNDNIISPASVLWDVPAAYQINELQTYRPTNYDMKFHGPVTARTALANSYNVPAVKLLDALGVPRMVEIGRALGLLSLTGDPESYNLPLTLGANEVTLLDLTTAYHSILEQGRYTPYRALLEVTDGLGNLLELPQHEPVQVVSPDAAYQVTSILSDNDARAPTFGTNSALRLSRPAAAKTGTTFAFRDNLTVGFTRYLVVGVWAGNANGQPMRGVTGVTGAAPIWHEFQEAVLADPAMLETLDAPADDSAWVFAPPDTLVRKALECPAKISCSNGDYFSRSWLNRNARYGAQGESAVVNDKVMLVMYYSGGAQNYVGVCSHPEGTERSALRLPAGYGRFGARSTSVPGPDALGPIAPNMPLPVERALEVAPMPSEVVPQVKEERLQAVSWSRRNATYLHLGPCGDIYTVVQGVFGETVRSVYLVNFQGRVVQTLDSALAATASASVAASSPISVALPGDVAASVAPTSPLASAALQTPTPTPATETPLTLFALAGVRHDNACPGAYILGSVLDAAGAPIAGARLVAVDQWGNTMEAVSKNGQGDYGQFDFPIADVQRDYYVTVVNGDGTPLSVTLAVQHRSGEAANSSCHYVVWQAQN